MEPALAWIVTWSRLTFSSFEFCSAKGCSDWVSWNSPRVLCTWPPLNWSILPVQGTVDSLVPAVTRSSACDARGRPGGPRSGSHHAAVRGEARNAVHRALGHQGHGGLLDQRRHSRRDRGGDG